MTDFDDLLSDESPSQDQAQKVLFDLQGIINPLPDEWPQGLFLLRGAQKRLDGLIVYHDFRWIEVFPHGKAMFPQGQALACLVRKDCPKAKTPALLLTVRPNVKPGVRETSREYIAVVNINEYLSQSSNHAESYFSGKLKADGKSVLEALRAVEQHPAELRTFVNKHINLDAIADWAEEDPARLQQLSSIIDRRQSQSATAEAFEALLAQLAGGSITEDQTTAVVKLLAGQSQLGCLVSALAEKVEDLKGLPRLGKEDSRRMVAAALRASHRADAIEELKRLIEEGPEEKYFQRLLDANWWMFGTQYVEKIDKRHWTDKDTLDMLLRRASSFFDIIELKRANEVIFKRDDHNEWIISG